ncbi:MAG: twin-arginine translocase TatA/TatE family subunit [Muribaculaceae bacterium]|nr:twin-arginine translocase TatA/TatE family subunit [Muribaculaceae bacterium]
MLIDLIPLFINRIGGPQLIIILFIILLLFGAKKIPDLMKSLGKGVNSFKQGLNDIEKDTNLDDNDKTQSK